MYFPLLAIIGYCWIEMGVEKVEENLFYSQVRADAN